MNFYVWLFPIIFIFHDMEEIVGFIPWLNKNKSFLEKKYSKFIKNYEGVSTEGFALAVFEELILLLIICIASYFSDFYGIWLGGFIGCVLHFFVHIIESIVVRKYIPALITSILALPVGIYIIYDSIRILSYPTTEIVIYSILGALLIGVNIRFAHWIMSRYSKANKI